MKRDESAELSATIEHIYDAALDPALWPRTLARIAAFVEGYSATIFSKTSSLCEGAVYYHDGVIAPEYQDAYFARYIRLDPANTLQYFGEIEKPVSVSSLIPPEELTDTRFFREWAEPQGLVDFVTVALEKSVAAAALFGVFRHRSQGLADETVLRRMSLVAPHVRRAVFIGRAFDIKAAENAALSDTLDGLSSALFLVDRDARIVHANKVAYHALERRDLCRAPGGKLAFLDREANDMLRTSLAEFSLAPANDECRDLVLSFERADGERFIAHILPLKSPRGRIRNSSAAVAVVYLQRAALELDSAPTVIARTYGLTPTELRVLLAIVEIGGVPETAVSLGIGEGTVKTHLRRIFAKTGAARQADLVRLVATHGTPMNMQLKTPDRGRLQRTAP
jgi:DNA-binding CsgD family transcriptional regulator